jgi:regulator of protease activity HflC (stomatin/prohibitin superfamily)
MKTIVDAIVLIAGIGIGLMIWTPHRGTGQAFRAAVIAGIVAFVFLVAGFSLVAGIGVVTAGDVGIVTQFGKPTGELKQPGIYAVFEPLGYSVYVMEATKIRSHDVNNASAATFDLQQVTTDITMNFHLNDNPQSLVTVYSTLRDNFDGLLSPITLEALKAVTAHFSAQDLIDKRVKAKDELDDLLRDRLGKYGIIVDNVSLTQFRFSDQFNAAIEAKVTQEQSALQAKAKLDQVKYEAEQTVTRAQAEATSLRLRRQEVTPDLIALQRLEVEKAAIEKWNGEMPKAVGNGAMVLPSDIFGTPK